MAAQANLIQKIHIQPASALSGVDGDEPVEPAREDAPASAAMLSADVGKIEDVQEKLLDLVWYMRERGFDGALCTAIRQEAGKLADIVHAQQPSGLVAEVSQSVACVREAGPAATSGEAMSREAMSRETMSLETMSLETMPLAELPGGQDVSDRRCAPVTEPAVGEGRAEGLQASPVRRVPDTAQPSKIAALAQKAAAFAPIDQLSEQEKLALFS